MEAATSKRIKDAATANSIVSENKTRVYLTGG